MKPLSLIVALFLSPFFLAAQAMYVNSNSSTSSVYEAPEYEREKLDKTVVKEVTRIFQKRLLEYYGGVSNAPIEYFLAKHAGIAVPTEFFHLNENQRQYFTEQLPWVTFQASPGHSQTAPEILPPGQSKAALARQQANQKAKMDRMGYPEERLFLKLSDPLTRSLYLSSSDEELNRELKYFHRKCELMGFLDSRTKATSLSRILLPEDYALTEIQELIAVEIFLQASMNRN